MGHPLKFRHEETGGAGAEAKIHLVILPTLNSVADQKDMGLITIQSCCALRIGSITRFHLSGFLASHGKALLGPSKESLRLTLARSFSLLRSPRLQMQYLGGCQFSDHGFIASVHSSRTETRTIEGARCCA
jgi:hypothetical protein